MRDDISIADQIRQLQIERDEIKNSQNVGESQILVKTTISDTITITSTTNDYFAQAFAYCKLDAPSVTGDNVLIAYCTAEVVKPDSTLVTNSDPDPMAYSWFINPVKTETGDTAGFQLAVYHSSIEGEIVPVETFKVTFHVFSAANVDLTVAEGLYE